MTPSIPTVKNHPFQNKRVLLRVDFNVAMNPRGEIADDERITQALPTIEYLLNKYNKLILISHLDRPKKRDYKYSLLPVAKRLQKFLTNQKVILVDDFLSEEGKNQLKNQKEKEVMLLENIRFYDGEQDSESQEGLALAKQLASFGDVYVNDAFGVAHRKDTSVFLLPKLLPSYAGLLLEKEINSISSILNGAKKPIVAIIGGAKISTKIAFLSKLMTIADYLLLGGGLANTFLLAIGKEVGKSLVEKEELQKAKEILRAAALKKTHIILPTDVIGMTNSKNPQEKMFKVDEVPRDFSILDIGPETQAVFAAIIAKAKTIVWNGPVGYCENESFCKGTDFLYYSIAHNTDAFSLVGGGDTLAAISKKEYLDKITHISTGGGAMLEFIENGNLPGIEALKK